MHRFATLQLKGPCVLFGRQKGFDINRMDVLRNFQEISTLSVSTCLLLKLYLRPVLLLFLIVYFSFKIMSAKFQVCMLKLSQYYYSLTGQQELNYIGYHIFDKQLFDGSIK